ncbi:unnamed protein product [Lymnaea stagnalis]|uniref:Major royal jelly protein n=1 Tax=Lymnaea stagnalis TaxID=6523 RepID=A0AAV2HSB4_LYMST
MLPDMQHRRTFIFDYRLLLGLCIVSPYVLSETFGQSELVYEWTSLELDWPSDTERNQALRSGTYVPDRNVIAGIKVYKNDVYLTVPRWSWTSGVPITLANVVMVQGQPKLHPFPDWATQKQGDCRALQYVQSMEIDPNTGLLYAIDTGRVGIGFGLNPLNLCPPKLVVFDLNTRQEVDRYEFPENVVSNDNNFLNDIVLHYVDGRVRYAYISDVSEGRLHVYDFETRSSHNFEDPSMLAEGGNGSVIHINGKDYTFQVAVDGIAISPDFKYLYFCPLSGYNLYQIPTSALTSSTATDTTKPRMVGKKVAQSGGIAFGTKRLYFGAMGMNAVYYWDVEADQLTQRVATSGVKMATQTEVVRNDATMQWPDTLAFDNQGWLWFVSNRLQLFVTGSMDFTGSDGANMRVWKVFVNETGYLCDADVRTRTTIVG